MTKFATPLRLRPRQRIGKFRIDRRLARGGFADVYQAHDTIEGVRVALKIPRMHAVTRPALEVFRKEVRLTARLDHPNILPIKNADFVDGHFVIVYPLGERTLSERLRTRIGLRTAIDYAQQILDALAHAHEKKVIHCDVKPDNLVLFDHDRLVRLADFGIARFGFRTVMPGSGSGTVGYLAPEQALGQVSYRSDVFSAGLVLYRMFSGRLPTWPFEWPPDGYDVLRRKLHPDAIGFLRRSLQVDARVRFEDAAAMRDAFERVKRRALGYNRRRRRPPRRNQVDWKTLRWKEFQTLFGRVLQTRWRCEYCEGPVSETMHACPWCGVERFRHGAESRLPASCPRCRRGLKLDWTYCPWCYGSSVGPLSDREFPDRSYQGRCSGPECTRRVLMPFMRYCPWCHRKVQRRWKITGSADTCRRCGWGVATAFWDFCAWCGAEIRD